MKRQHTNQSNFAEAKDLIVRLVKRLQTNIANTLNKMLEKPNPCKNTKAVFQATRGTCNGKTAVVLLHLSKAFDSLNRGILRIKKLDASTEALKWFISYQGNRSQFAKAAYSALSEELDVGNGERQGSTLGPVLFCIYKNDIPFYS